MNFEVKINDLIGNIEYFFDLVKNKKINVLEFNLSYLIDEYILFLNKNLNDSSFDEAISCVFLLSYMLWMRSSLFISNELKWESTENDIDFELVNDDAINADLKQRLFLYKKIKDVTLYFQERKENTDKMFSKKISTIKNVQNENDNKYIFDFELLTNSFKNIAKYFKETGINVSKIKRHDLDPILIEKIIIEKLVNIFDNKTLLINLVKSISNNIEYLIAIFLAVLNLAKKNLIYLFQEKNDVFIELISNGMTGVNM